MPCYVTKIGSASKEEYDKVFLCGELGEHCAECMDVADVLCDYPVGEGKTCDRLLCANHAKEVAPDIHYCSAHYREWTAFRDGGGVARHLENVVAFKDEK